MSGVRPVGQDVRQARTHPGRGLSRMPRGTVLRHRTVRIAAAVAALAVAVPAAGSHATQQGSGPAKNPARISCGTKAPVVTNAAAKWQRFPAPTFTTAIGGSV